VLHYAVNGSVFQRCKLEAAANYKSGNPDYRNTYLARLSCNDPRVNGTEPIGSRSSMAVCNIDGPADSFRVDAKSVRRPDRLPLEKIPRGRQPALTIRHEQSLVCRTLRCRPETPTPEPGSALLEESA
jgi:hypothetical protein